MQKTTLLTLLGSVAGLLNQAATTGVAVPQTKQEWAATGMSLAFAAIGYLAKGTEKK